MSKHIRAAKHRELLKRAKHKTRIYNQCSVCGRRRSYIRQFGICRICLRKFAHEGLLPGVVKSSW